VQSPLISPPDLMQRLGAPDVILVDTRFDLMKPEAGRLAYQSGHIPGAVYADLNRDLSAPVVPGVTGRHPLPDPNVLARTLGSWGVSPSSLVVAYDDASGAIAARLWWLLQWLGHERVQVLDGGFRAWLDEGGEVEVDVRAPQAARFEPDVRTALLAPLDEVRAASETGSPVLLDARATPRFYGDEEPIDPVPGHIPGARSVPFTTLLDAGRFAEPARVRTALERGLAGTPAEAAVCYCGSGVTACHLLLGAVHAGLPMPRLYAGSYSEWITDPNRPVERR